MDINPVDMLYPIDIVTWFVQNKDPNTLFPGTTWKYIGENRTVRLASGDVMTIGGSNLIKLSVDNLLAHGHGFSANSSTLDYGTKTTSNFDYGTKQTDVQGRHTHGYLGYNIHGDNGLNFRYTQFEVNKQTDPAGEHAHNVAIGAHNHTFAGITDNVGSGSATIIVNAYIKLIGWYKSA